MAENFSDNAVSASASRLLKRRWWFGLAALLLVVIAAAVISALRGPTDEVARRTAEILAEVRRAERSQGQIANWAHSMPGPLAAVGEWLFPRGQKGSHEFAQELGEVGSDAVPILVATLAKDPSPLVREISAMSLGNFGDRGTLPAMTNALAGDVSPGVREAVLDALAEIGDVAALPAMLRTMRADTNDSVRAAAVTAVARLGGTAVASELLAAGAQESEWNVRISFARALADAQESRAVPLFASWLAAPPATNDPANVEAPAQFGIQSYHASRIIEAVGELGGEPAYQLLTNCWSTEDEEVRTSICVAFGALGDARALPCLVEALTGEKDVRAAAVRALGQLGDTNALSALMPLAEDADQQVRESALVGIGQLGGRFAVPPVLTKAMASGTNREFRASLCEMLGEIGDPVALDVILAVLPEIRNGREKVLWVVGHLGDSNAIPVLAAALTSVEREESFAAAYALAEIGGEAAADAVAASLAHKDEFARHGKACALAMLGRTNGLATVRQGLVAKEAWRRFGATLALARLGLSPDAAEWKPILGDRDPALRRLGQEAAAGRVVPALVEMLQHPKHDFRQYAARGLIFFRDPTTLPALRQAERDRDSQVQSAARLAVNFIERTERVGQSPE